MDAPDPAFIARRTMRLELRDGTPVVIRPIVPDDKWRLQEGLTRLSPRSRYRRFMSPLERLSPRQLAYFTELDYHDHFAYIALLANASEPGVGVARYIRLADEPKVAEAAVTVIDEYHGRGAGTLLLRALAPVALENGVRFFRTYVLSDNRPMLDIVREAGAHPVIDEAGVMRADIDLAESLEAVAGSTLTRLFRAAAKGELDVLRPSWIEEPKPDGPARPMTGPTPDTG